MKTVRLLVVSRETTNMVLCLLMQSSLRAYIVGNSVRQHALNNCQAEKRKHEKRWRIWI